VDWTLLWRWAPWLLEQGMSLIPTEQKTLMGSWFVESTTGDYIGSWMFRPDRSVTVNACSTEGTGSWAHQEGKGTWEITNDRVRIVWSGQQPGSPERCWDALLRPIKASGVHGDSWKKVDRWRARKIIGL
jgi:hypothetical protein